MSNKQYDNIKVPENIDSVIDIGARKAKVEKKKRNNKKIISIAAALVVVILVGTTSQPALAEKLPVISNIYESLGFGEKYNSISKYVGKSIESNGIKVTIEKIIATENFIKIAVKTEANYDAFDGPTDLLHITASVEGKNLGSGGGAYVEDKRNQHSVIELMSDDGFPNKGIIKLDVDSDKHNIHESIELNTNFIDSYKDNYNKTVSMEEENSSVEIEKLESTKAGTFVKFKRKDNMGWDFCLMKVDNKLYSHGASSADENSMQTIFPDLTDDIIKNAKELAIIQIDNGGLYKSYRVSSEMTEEEVKAVEAKSEEDTKKYEEAVSKLPGASKNGVDYIPELKSIDGEKVEISDVIREDGKVKIKVTGTSKDHMLRVVNTMDINYSIDNTYNIERMITEVDNGYVVEFKDKKDSRIKVRIGDILNEKKGRIFGDEIAFKFNK